MRRAVGYGIDFGTTNSSISIGYDDGSVEVVSLSENPVQPQSLRSLVYVDRNDQRAAGSDAVRSYQVTGAGRTRCDRCPLVMHDHDGTPYSDCRMVKPSGGCTDSRLLAGLKSELANTEFTSTHSWATDFEIVDLVSIVISELKRRADRVAGEPIDRVVLGHPVAFVGAGSLDGTVDERLQDRAKRFLDAAAKKAGFTDVRMMAEPEAAVVTETLPDGYAISVDFGGGTFDTAVLETIDGAPTTVSVAGTAVGGVDFDAALFELAVAEAIGLRDEIEDGRRIHRYPAAIKVGMRTLAGTRHLLADAQVPFTLINLERSGIDTAPVRAILEGGVAFEFYGAIEQAKVELSESLESQIYFIREGLLAVIEDVSRSALNAATTSLLDRIRHTIIRALRQAGVDRSDIGVVIRTGGSSMIPAFLEMLSDVFPRSDIRARPAFTSVAAGLGTMAAEVWADVR